MRGIKESLELQDPIEVVKEIAERKNLLFKMIGQLYPMIIDQELNQLEKLYYSLDGKNLANALWELKNEN